MLSVHLIAASLFIFLPQFDVTLVQYSSFRMQQSGFSFSLLQNRDTIIFPRSHKFKDDSKSCKSSPAPYFHKIGLYLGIKSDCVSEKEKTLSAYKVHMKKSLLWVRK